MNIGFVPTPMLHLAHSSSNFTPISSRRCAHANVDSRKRTTFHKVTSFTSGCDSRFFVKRDLFAVREAKVSGEKSGRIEVYSMAEGQRSPPPDLPSLLLNARIVYLGMPLVPAVTELIIAQLLFLQYMDASKPVIMYINSTGSARSDGENVGFDTEAFAIVDTMAYVKPPVHTVCVGSAYGMAAMLLASGAKTFRAALPHATIMLNQPKSSAQGQATEIAIKAREMLANRQLMLEILAQKTGQPLERIKEDSKRTFYLSPDDAVTYGLIDRVLSPKDLPQPIPAMSKPPSLKV